VSDLDALASAARLTDLGIVVRSQELADLARSMNAFHARGGNRAMRRAAARAGRRSGRKVRA